MERKWRISQIGKKSVIFLEGAITGVMIAGVAQAIQPSAAEAPSTNQQPMALQLDNPSLASEGNQPKETNVDEVLDRVLKVNTGFQETSPQQTEGEEPQEETKEKDDFPWLPLALAGAAVTGLAGVVVLRRRIVS